MTDQTAWLIERADPRNPGCVLPNSFLGVVGSFDGVRGLGHLEWLMNASDALRFARKRDAAMFVGMMEGIFDKLPHAQTLPGLRDGDAKAIVVEHIWDGCHDG